MHRKHEAAAVHTYPEIEARDKRKNGNCLVVKGASHGARDVPCMHGWKPRADAVLYSQNQAPFLPGRTWIPT